MRPPVSSGFEVQFTALVTLQQLLKRSHCLPQGLLLTAASCKREVMLCWTLHGHRREQRQRQRHGPNCLLLVEAAPAAVTKCSLVAHSKGSVNKAHHTARPARKNWMRRHTRSPRLCVHQRSPQLRGLRVTTAQSRSSDIASLRRRRGAGNTPAALRGLRSGTGTDRRCSYAKASQLPMLCRWPPLLLSTASPCCDAPTCAGASRCQV